MRKDLHLKSVLSPEKEKRAIRLLKETTMSFELLASRLGVSEKAIKDLNNEKGIRIYENGKRINPPLW